MPLNRNDLARITRNIDKTSSPEGCWLWTGPLMRDGYGFWRVKPGERPRAVHLIAYEHYVGPIPEGMQGGHGCHDRAVEEGTCEGGPTCRHRRCLNPDHQVMQTPSQNTKAQNHAQRRKTHCPNGHLYDEASTYEYRGRRFCRVCDREKKRALRDAKPSP